MSFSKVSAALFVVAVVALTSTEQALSDSVATPAPQQAQAESYFSQASKYFDSGTQRAQPEAQSFRSTKTNSVTDDEQRSTLMLRDSIGKATG